MCKPYVGPTPTWCSRTGLFDYASLQHPLARHALYPRSAQTRSANFIVIVADSGPGCHQKNTALGTALGGSACRAGTAAGVPHLEAANAALSICVKREKRSSRNSRPDGSTARLGESRATRPRALSLCSGYGRLGRWTVVAPGSDGLEEQGPRDLRVIRERLNRAICSNSRWTGLGGKVGTRGSPKSSAGTTFQSFGL